jgi:hypothetical protein
MKKVVVLLLLLLLLSQQQKKATTVESHDGQRSIGGCNQTQLKFGTDVKLNQVLNFDC